MEDSGSVARDRGKQGDLSADMGAVVFFRGEVEKKEERRGFRDRRSLRCFERVTSEIFAQKKTTSP